MHAHFTDALYGPDIATAARAFTTWAAVLDVPVVVTLHDVPGGDPDAARDRRRCAGYREVVRAADAVVVSSGHEAAKVRAFSGADATVVPLPLPSPPPAGAAPDWADRPTVVVLGFVYPGKGHAAAIEVAARRPEPPLVVAAGGPAAGHDDLLDDLHRLASDRGVEFACTGTVSDAELGAAARAATVPVALHPGASASGSLLTWLAHARRPVVLAGPYSREVGSRTGALLLCEGDDDVDRAVDEAVGDPSLTRLAGPPDWPDVGAAHVAVYRRVLGFS